MIRTFKALAIFGVFVIAAPLTLAEQGCSSSSSNPSKPKPDGGPKADAGPKPDAGPKDAGPKDSGPKPDAGPKPDGGKSDGGKTSRAGQTAMAYASEQAARDTRSLVPEAACEGDGEAWCSGDGRVTVCLQNRIYEFECSATGDGNVCSDDLEEELVDCTPIGESE